MLKSRLALTALIAVGAMMSGTGATLAVTGSSGSGSAEQHQYTTPTTETTPTTTTTVTETETVQTTSTTESQPTLAPQQVAGDQDEGGDDSPSEDSDTEPTEQVEVAGDSDESLPFTGFLAIPLLLGGVAMIATGGVLRHRSRDSE